MSTSKNKNNITIDVNSQAAEQQMSFTDRTKKQVFIQLENDEDNNNEYSESNQQMIAEGDQQYEDTSNNNRSQYSRSPNINEFESPQLHTNEYEENEEGIQEYSPDPELFERILQETLDRQDLILQSLGDDIQLPMVDQSLMVSNYQCL